MIAAILEIAGKHFLMSPGKHYLLAGPNSVSTAPTLLKLEDISIAEKHALIRVGSSDCAFICDLCSESGTFVNGEKLEPLVESIVKEMITFRVGNVEGKLRLKMPNESCNSSGFNEEFKNRSGVVCFSPESHTQSEKSTGAFADVAEVSDPFLNIENVCINESNVGNVSLISNEDEDICIPETQVVSNSNQKFARQSNFEDAIVGVDATLPQNFFTVALETGETIVNEFRICTQEFNDDCDADEIESNISNIPIDAYSPDVPVQCSVQKSVATSESKISQSQSNESAQTIVNAHIHDSIELKDTIALNLASETNSGCKIVALEERTVTCTPDLFDLPELEAENWIPSCADAAVKNAAEGETVEMPTSGKDLVGVEAPVSSTILSDGRCSAVILGPGKMHDFLPTQVCSETTGENIFSSYVTANIVECKIDREAPVENLDLNDILPTQVVLPTSICSDASLSGQGKLTKPTMGWFTEAVEGKYKDDKIVRVKTREELIMSTPTVIRESFSKYFLEEENVGETDKNVSTILTYPICNDFESLIPELKCNATPSGMKDDDALNTEFRPSHKRKLIGDKNFESKHRKYDANSKPEQESIENASSIKVRTNLKEETNLQASQPEEEKEITRKQIASGKLVEEINIQTPEINILTEIKTEKEILKAINQSDASEPQRNMGTKLEKAERIPIETGSGKSAEIPLEKIKKLSTTTKTSLSFSDPKIKQERNTRTSARLRSKSEAIENESSQKENVLTTGGVPSAPTKKELKRRETSSLAVSIKSKVQTKRTAKSEGKKTDKSNQQSRPMEKTQKADVQKGERTQKKLGAELQAAQKRISDSSTCLRSQRVRESNNNDNDSSTASVGNVHLSFGATPEPAASSSSSPYLTSLKISMSLVKPALVHKLSEGSSGIWTIAKDPLDSDILVMDQATRTFKFLLALAKGIPIVTTKWLKCVNDAKTVVRMDTHFFRDKEFEKRHKFVLPKTLQLARKSKLFAGYEFLMTPQIQPIPEEMKALISCAGGQVHLTTPVWKANQKVYLVSSKEDKKQWHAHRRLNSNIRIIGTEGVMAAIIRFKVLCLDADLLA